MVLRHRSWLDLCGHQLPSNDKRHQDGLPVLRSTVALHHRSSLDDIKMAFVCCDEQWCFTTNVCLIFVSTCFNQQLQTCPLSAAQCNGVVPCSSLTFGFKGFFSKLSSSINSLLVDAEIMRWVCSASVWKNSKITSISFTGDEAKISSSGISEPSSEKSLCLKMLTSILGFAIQEPQKIKNTNIFLSSIP